MSNQEHTGGLSRRRCTRSDPRRGTDRLGRLFGQLRQPLRAAFTRSR